MGLVKGKRKKRSINELHDPTFEEMQTKIMRCPPDVRSYLCLLWLTGNRVSEILGIKTRTQVGVYTYVRPTKRNPNRIVTVAKYRNLKPEEREELGIGDWEVEPVRKWDIEIDPIRPIIRLKNVHTLKRQGRPRHTYIARIDRPEEEVMWKMVVQHIDSISPDQPLFSFSRQKAWLYCDRFLGVPPHKLRGLRATRDAEKLNLDAIDLQNKFNWASPAMPLFYAKKNTRELEDKLLRTK